MLQPRLVVAEAGLAPLSGVASVAAGERHGLALLNDGRVLAWGRDFNATLGRGVVDNSLYAHVPAAVRGEGGSGTLSLPTGAYPNLTNRAR